MRTKPAPWEAGQRLLETAGRLFYGDGFRSVGIDRIIAAARVAPMTLDSHVPQTNSLILFTEAFGPAAVSLLPAISLLVEEALAPPQKTPPSPIPHGSSSKPSKNADPGNSSVFLSKTRQTCL